MNCPYRYGLRPAVQLPMAGPPGLLQHHGQANATPSAEERALAERVLEPLPRALIDKILRVRRSIGLRLRGFLGRPNTRPLALTAGQQQAWPRRSHRRTRRRQGGGAHGTRLVGRRDSPIVPFRRALGERLIAGVHTHAKTLGVLNWLAGGAQDTLVRT